MKGNNAVIEISPTTLGGSLASMWEVSPGARTSQDKPRRTDRSDQPHKRPYKRGKEWQRSSWKEWAQGV